MVALVKLCISICLVLCFISTATASGECGVNDFVIGAVRTGRTRQVPTSGRRTRAAAEWNVQIVNTCNCSLSNITVSCPRFQSYEPVDPAIFQKNGDLCSVNQGRPLPPKASVNFSYIWIPPFHFRHFSTHSLC